jgi:hypothetical protein
MIPQSHSTLVLLFTISDLFPTLFIGLLPPGSIFAFTAFDFISRGHISIRMPLIAVFY